MRRDLAQMRYRAPRLVHSPCQCIACSADTAGQSETRQLPQGLFRPGKGDLKAARYQVRRRHEALKLGEAEDRLLLLDAWRESQLYTPRERAALAWAESLTRIAKTHAPDGTYEEAKSVFSEDELLTLSIGIAMINAWNRLAIGFRQQHPADRPREAAIAAQ